MLFLFWFSAFMIFYAYFGYPICLLLILAFRRIKNMFMPSTNSINTTNSINITNSINTTNQFVSFIITAYNEEKRIRDKIENSLNQDYPKEKLEIIIASDCSNDNTDQIVGTYSQKGVKLTRSPERKGKENAQKHAADAARGEILVFSDVATILKPDGISNIVKNFHNPLIGCVSSEDRFIDNDGKVSGEGAYVKYEMFLRKLESTVNTVVGLSGSFFAARQEVCENWKADLQSDFNTLLNSIKLGLRGISDPRSLGYYKNIIDEKMEFERKIRTVLRGISVLMRNLSLLNPARYGMFSWQLFSHKLCRWLVPFFLIIVFLMNLFIVIDTGGKFKWIYGITLLLQIGLYVMALTYSRKQSYFGLNYNSMIPSKLASLYIAISKIIYFFVVVNLSIMVAWGKYLTGKRAVLWEPSKR